MKPIFILCCVALAAVSSVQAITLEQTGRKVFVWKEPNAALTIKVSNQEKVPAELPAFTLEGDGWSIPLNPETNAPLAPQETRELALPFAVCLLPGTYQLTLTAGPEKLPVALEVVTLPHDAMPVVSWSQADDPATMEQYGFTHTLRYQYAYSERKNPAGGIANLDDMLRHRIRLLDNFSMTIDDLPRLRQDKTPAPHSVDAANPEAQRRARRYFAPSVQMFGRHPGYGGAIIGIEGRDHTLPSWSGFEEKAFKKFAGYPIPATIIGKTAPHFRTIADFPRTRIVADDYPLLVYYRWFWEQGDGYPTLNSLSADILRESGNKELWSFSDPAVRCPPKWGSGGSVDFLSQWTYCYPDPIKIAQATDELFAMAAGRPGQGVMKMTQAIWYREQTAPAKQTVTTPPAWATENPTTEFITIAPDLLKEAFWSKLSRPIAGIMYHGYGSLFNDIKITKESMYTMTNPESREVLKELVQTVVQPLGPTLKHLPARTSEVAILESFASTIFAGRGTWGWGRGWIADVHLMTQWAGLQPVIVYEETILRDRLVGIKVLVLPHCEVLPQAAFNAIRDFQRAGGILVGDEFTIPALLPNLRLASYTRTGDAVKDKAALQQMAAQFRQDLASVLTPYATSDNPDIVTYARAAGNADYIFAVNDKRTYGDYVGMYGLVMEKGLPNRGTVTVRRPAAAVYDPVRHQSVPFTVSDGVTAIPVEFTTSDGRLLMLTDAAVTAVKIAAIPEAGGVNVTVTVTDADGKPITADFPLEITVTAADGARLPASDYYRAANGVVHIAIPKFYQGAPFPWRIKAKDLASGLSGEQTVNGAE